MPADSHSNDGVVKEDSELFELRSKQTATPTMVRPTRQSLTIGLLVCFIVLLATWDLYQAYGIWIAGRTIGLVPGPNAGEVGAAQLGSGSGTGGPTFDLSNVTVPAGEILSGGPPKDGIPALTNPRFVAAREAGYLTQDDRVIGFVRGQEARAYPLKILNYHEIVNDRVGDLPVAICYCPLCDSAAAFDRRTPLGEREFGVSGLLYNSNVLMYDRGGRPESLWSQIKGRGISGPAADKPLTALPMELTTWRDWRTRFAHTVVLSAQTGHPRDYRSSPYTGYFRQPGLMFPARPTSDRLPTKARVLGVWTETAARAYPESAFSADRPRVEGEIGGKRVVIQFNPRARSLRVAKADKGVQWMYSLWFAWYAFRPETEIFR